MQNEFEKQVQQKMGELHLVPSAPVWEKVEKQIRKKREKRRFFFFLLPVGLLVGFAIWWISLENKEQSTLENKRVSSNTTIQPKKYNAPHSQDPIQKQTEKPSETSTQTPVTETGKDNNNKKGIELTTPTTLINLSTSSRNTSNNKSVNTAFQKPLVAKKQKGTKKEEIMSSVISNTSDGPDEKKPNTSTNPAIDKTDKNVATNNIPVVANVQKPNEKTSSDSTFKKDTVKKENAKPEIKIADSTVKKKVAKSDRKWEKTFTFQAGASKYQDGFFSGARADQLYSGLPTGSVGPPSYSSPELKKGFSFAVGAGIQKKLTERMTLSATLQYHYYSVQSRIGQQVQKDTAVRFAADSLQISNYYAAGGNNQYTTRYGIVEIPVSISYQLFKKLPLEYSLGASYGHLLSSNALTKSSSGTIYYHNKKNNTKNFISFFTSLQYRVFAKNKMKIKAGPILQFIPTQLQKENRFTNSHLFFAGIKANINF